jgi:ectoine hydroxylase-related dioxygenase (phytanoyl-CoA dioxygenase family)
MRQQNRCTGDSWPQMITRFSKKPNWYSDLRAEHAGQVLARDDAGSLLVFNGSAWHGHTANTSSGPRRSIQGAFIPRDGRAGTDFAAGMQSETRARLGPLARQVLAL